jgi:hypothetical protein
VTNTIEVPISCSKQALDQFFWAFSSQTGYEGISSSQAEQTYDVSCSSTISQLTERPDCFSTGEEFEVSANQGPLPFPHHASTKRSHNAKICLCEVTPVSLFADSLNKPESCHLLAEILVFLPIGEE